MKGVDRAAVHGGRVGQVRGRRQQIRWNQREDEKKKTADVNNGEKMEAGT